MPKLLIGSTGEIAVAQNGSLLLNSRGPAQGVRWESWSHDAGETWTPPLVSDYGFGSSCQGSVVRDGTDLLFAHPGRIGGEFNRWNLTVWRSRDSGASWAAADRLGVRVSSPRSASRSRNDSPLVLTCKRRFSPPRF